MNFNITDFLKLFGSAYKVSFIIFACGLFLIFISDDIKQSFYLKSFVESYGLWLGIATLLSGTYIAVSTFEKIISYFKNNNYNTERREKLLTTLRNLGIEEKKILAYFLSQNKQITLFKFQYIAAIPDSIGHLQQMGFLYEISNEYGTYYYKLHDEVWEVLQISWTTILNEKNFPREVKNG